MALPRAWGPAPPVPPKVTPPRGGHALPPGRAPRSVGPSSSGGGAGASSSGLPALKSSQEIQAEANATAWKSIQKMMGTLPSFGAIDQPYSAQRSAIQPLVDAHRDWLMKAGNYQTQMTNGLAQLLYSGAAGADASQQGMAASAGAPMGSAPASNVTPGAASVVPVALGGSTANYLQSLIPFATAQGIGNVGKVNAAEQGALLKLTDAKNQISGQYGDLSNKAYNSLQTSYFDKYKSELAAITAGNAVGLKSSALDETARHHKALEGLMKSRNLAVSNKASAATTTAAAKTLAAQTKFDKNLSLKALQDSRKVYDKVGGSKVSGAGAGHAYSMQLTYAPTPTTQQGLTHTSPSKQSWTITGNSPQEVLNQIKTRQAGFKASQPGVWQQGNMKSLPGASGAGGSSVTGRKGEYTRRMQAWRTFKTEMDQANSPLSTAELQSIFRSQFGDPGKK